MFSSSLRRSFSHGLNRSKVGGLLRATIGAAALSVLAAIGMSGVVTTPVRAANPVLEQALALTTPREAALEVIGTLSRRPTIELRPCITYLSAGKWYYINAGVANTMSGSSPNVQTYVTVIDDRDRKIDGVRVSVEYRRAGTGGKWEFYGAQVSGRGYWIIDVRTGRRSWYQERGVAPFNPLYLPRGTWDLRYTADGATLVNRRITIG